MLKLLKHDKLCIIIEPVVLTTDKALEVCAGMIINHLKGIHAATGKRIETPLTIVFCLFPDILLKPSTVNQPVEAD